MYKRQAKARAAVRGGVKPGRTMPTLPLNTAAKGAPPKVLGTMTDDQARSLKRQIESGDLLARYGFDVTHEPGARPNGKQPDYVIAGTFWDCYAPVSYTHLDVYKRQAPGWAYPEEGSGDSG